jgi:putative lipase involved disintegration of autophagic bodies
MRFILLFIFCVTVSFSASAQWWNISLKKHQRFPQLAHVSDQSLQQLPTSKLSSSRISAVNFIKSTDYYLELAEAVIMKTAQHNMRFRVYNTASYNFSELARLYIQQNRFSEAKWYLLQSNNISRQQNDDKHTIANLMDLAMVKANLGDLVLAQLDLTEAHQIAVSKGWTANLFEIEKESQYILHNKTTTPALALRYADDATTDKKAD